MHQKFASQLNFWLFSVTLSLWVFASTTSHSQSTTTNSITFDYTDDAKLTPAQVQTVLTIAKDCGLKSPAVIGTGKTLPFAVRFVYVQSATRTNGRKITFESVHLHYSEWSKGRWKREGGAKYLGDFWVTPPFLTTNAYTLFKINNKTTQLTCDERIPLSVADKMLKAFEDGKFELPSQSATNQIMMNITRDELQNLSNLEPSSLLLDNQQACYEMFIFKKPRYIRFTFWREKLKILSVSSVDF